MDFTPEALGVWVLILLFVAKFWMELRKDQRESRGEKGEELKELEERLQGEVNWLKGELRDVRQESREGQKEVFLQMQGATNGIARMEGSLITLEKSLSNLREN